MTISITKEEDFIGNPFIKISEKGYDTEWSLVVGMNQMDYVIERLQEVREEIKQTAKYKELLKSNN